MNQCDVYVCTRVIVPPVRVTGNTPASEHAPAAPSSAGHGAAAGTEPSPSSHTRPLSVRLRNRKRVH